MPTRIHYWLLKYSIFALAITLAWALAACHTHQAEPVVVTYLSSSSERLIASFNPQEQTVTVTLPSGQSFTLPRAPSGSGARFAQGNRIFWEHQGSARFFEGDHVVFEGRSGR